MSCPASEGTVYFCLVFILLIPPKKTGEQAELAEWFSLSNRTLYQQALDVPHAVASER